MKNDFEKETHDLFFDKGWCMSWETGINNADCLHHILGRCSHSAYNAAPLNNRNDHMPEGRIELQPLSSDKVRKKYLQKTKKYLNSIGYNSNLGDVMFLEKNAKYYK